MTETASVDVFNGEGDRDESILCWRRRPLLPKAISCSAMVG
jgi:hypothetical protein